MDPVTAYECRHKIKSGDACVDSHASFRAWVMMCTPNSVHMVERAFGADHDIAHTLLEQWARETGWPDQIPAWCARRPLTWDRPQYRRSWWRKHGWDVIGWGLLAISGVCLAYIGISVLMGVCQVGGHC